MGKEMASFFPSQGSIHGPAHLPHTSDLAKPQTRGRREASGKSTPYRVDRATTPWTDVRLHGNPQLAPTPHVIHTLHPICIPRIDMVIVKLQP